VNIDKNRVIGRFFSPDEDAAELMATWTESLKSFPGVDNIPFVKDEFIKKYGKMGNLSDDSIKTVIDDKNRLVKDEAALMLLWHCASFMYHSDNGHKNCGAIPQLDKSLPGLYCNFFMLLVLAGYPHAVEFYGQRALPKQVMQDTLKDLNVWVEQYQRELGITGLTHRILGWMQGHLTGGLFKIGRLQFQYPFTLNNYIMVFRHKITDELQMLSAAGIRYNRNGLIDGVGDVWDEDGHWMATLQEGDTEAEGNPISVAGFAENRLVKLELKEWNKVLDKGDEVLNIHIPAGEPMTPEACSESFEQAKHFFSKYFSDYDFKAFVCFSWLLDNQFEGILKPTSNILKFQHLGQIFPIGGESEAIYRIFGPKAKDAGIDAVPHVSSMQRAIAEFVHDGGVLRNGGFVRF
jgi:GNAT-like C-terminal domain/N-acyltransferase N-terminal domain